MLDLHRDDLRGLPGLAWAGYLGTTAVYGNHDGAWVDETTPLEPTLARADRRARAEAAWLGSGLPAHHLPPRRHLRAGPQCAGQPARPAPRGASSRPGQVFSRIHVEDIASTLAASIARPRPGAIYNVCDDEPSPPQDVIAFAAELLGIEPPPEQPYATAELPPMARTFYRDNRRVRNERIKSELGVRAGLSDLSRGAAGAAGGRRPMSRRLILLPERFAICRLPADAAWPSPMPAASFVSVTRTAEELSLILPEDAAPADGQRSDGWRCLKLEGPFDLAETGVLAPLAAAWRGRRQPAAGRHLRYRLSAGARRAAGEGDRGPRSGSAASSPGLPGRRQR